MLVSALLGWLTDFAWLCFALLAWLCVAVLACGWLTVLAWLCLSWFTVLAFVVVETTGLTWTLGAGADFVLVLGAVVDFFLVIWCRREPWPGTELGSWSGWRRGS